jgi:hypothetical protein
MSPRIGAAFATKKRESFQHRLYCCCPFANTGSSNTEGYGKAFPVASNADSGGRQLNRRVEVVIGGENGSLVAPRS